MKLIIAFLILMNPSAIIQDNSHSKMDALGIWKFKPESNLRTVESSSEVCILSQVHFKLDGSYEFILYDSTIEKGYWDIKKEGVLHLTERTQIPKTAQLLLPLDFKIKIKKRKHIILTFMEFDDNNNGREAERRFVYVE